MAMTAVIMPAMPIMECNLLKVKISCGVF